jgi:uncharacterized membrane protein YeaQ/YmgE (transglycosylase-associated protein family)
MGLIAWIFTSMIAGALAQKVTGFQKEGALRRIALGVLGGVLGGFLSTALFKGQGITHFGIRGIFLAFVGAVLISLVAGKFFGKKR